MTKQCKVIGQSPGSERRGVLLGKLGEDLAIEYYLSQGYELLHRNWRAGRFAELDLILRSPQGLLVFAEVKTRRVNQKHLGDDCTGFESIGWRKRQKIVTAARLFMSKLAAVDIPCRFDVLLVVCRSGGLDTAYDRFSIAGIVHVPDAF